MLVDRHTPKDKPPFPTGLGLSDVVSLVAVESPQMLAADEVLVVNAGDSGNVRSRLTRTFRSRQTVTTNRNHVVSVTMTTRLHAAGRGYSKGLPSLIPGPHAPVLKASPRANHLKYGHHCLRDSRSPRP